MQLTIMDELKALIPPLSADEYTGLEQSIIAEGCRDAITVWLHDGDNVIVDGHNRYAICSAHGLPYQTVTRDFDSLSDVKLWMIRNQLSRRNLTPFKRTELALQMEAVIAEQAKQQSGTRTDLLANLPTGSSINTRDEVARIAEVSSRNVDKVKHVLTDAPAPIVDKARTGEISIHAADQMTKALRGQPERVVALAMRVADDNADKVAILARLYKSNGKDGSNGTFDEIAINGGFHYGEEMDEWCDFAASTARQIEEALGSLANYHRMIEGGAKHVHVAQNSRENEWYTPAYLLDAARAVLGTFDVDPATSEIAQRTVQAGTYYTIEDDGLAQEWPGRVWMNPPYSQPEIKLFCDKLLVELEAGRTSDAIVLVNNATETGWGQSLLRACAAVCFLERRVKFLDASGQAVNQPLQGQMMILFTDNKTKVQLFEDALMNYGAVLRAR